MQVNQDFKGGWVGGGSGGRHLWRVARAAKNKCAARAVNFRLPCVCHARAVSIFLVRPAVVSDFSGVNVNINGN